MQKLAIVAVVVGEEEKDEEEEKLAIVAVVVGEEEKEEEEEEVEMVLRIAVVVAVDHN
jgi:hypothetical protein